MKIIKARSLQSASVLQTLEKAAERSAMRQIREQQALAQSPLHFWRSAKRLWHDF